MRSRSSPDRSRVSLARLVALLAMAAALWASQALALVHRVSHEPGHAHAGELFAHHGGLLPLAGRSLSAGVRLSF